MTAYTTRLTWITRACCASLLLGLAWPLPLRRVFPMNDILQYHVPLRQLYQRMLANGDSVLWTPALFAGFDLHGEGQVGLFHPLHQVLYRFLPLDVALNVRSCSAMCAGWRACTGSCGGCVWRRMPRCSAR